VAELGPGTQLHLHPRGGEGATQLAHAVGYPPDVGEEVAPHVGGGYDDAGAVRHSEPEELHALLEGVRPVIDTGKGVEVKLGSGLGERHLLALIFGRYAGISVNIP